MKLPLSLPPREAKPFDAVGFGQNSIDVLAVVPRFPVPNEKMPLAGFETMAGGEAATAMVACARLGWRSRYVGKAGNDTYGDLLLDALRREDVDVSAVQRVDAPNRMALILVDGPGGTRTVLWRRDPSLVVSPGDVNLAAVTSGRVLMLDAYDTGASIAVARAARAAGVPTVLDAERPLPGIDTLTSLIDVVIVSETFLVEWCGIADAGRGLRRLADASGAALTVVTLGASGSLAWCQGQEVRTPGFVVSVADPTGAGDAFRGGFIAGWMTHGEGGEVDTLMEYANAVAACNCRHVGAQAGLPSSREVEALVTGLAGARSK